MLLGVIDLAPHLTKGNMIIRLKYRKSPQGRGQLSIWIGPDKNHLMLSGQLMLFDEEMADFLTLLSTGADYWNEHSPGKFMIETEGYNLKKPVRKLDVDD
jgi:hypothetical protein